MKPTIAKNATICWDIWDKIIFGKSYYSISFPGYIYIISILTNWGVIHQKSKNPLKYFVSYKTNWNSIFQAHTWTRPLPRGNTIVHFHPVYFPVKQGMAYMNQSQGMIFYWNQDFSGKGVVKDVCVWGSVRDHSRAWKILVEIKNHPEIEVITEGRYTPYIASRDNILGGRVFYILTPPPVK